MWAFPKSTRSPPIPPVYVVVFIHYLITHTSDTMAIKLRVLISDSKAYPPTALCPVNSATPTRVKNDLFEGEVSVFVRGFDGEGASGDGGVYFDKRDDMTYGIVVRGELGGRAGGGSEG